MQPYTLCRSVAALLALAMLAGCATTRDTHTGATGVADPSAFRHALRPDLVPADDALPGWTIEERMAHYRVPGVAVAILRDGEIAYVAGFGELQAGGSERVDGDTLFSVGSVSKMIAAATTLRLAAREVVDIDRDVDTYLATWKIPPRDADIGDAPVTLRQVMSHTAGFNVHGFDDFQPGEPMPTTVQVLAGAAPAKNKAVRLTHAPGTRMVYSGGGITVEQLVLEDVTGAPFAQVAGVEVLAPLGMQRSTFVSPLPEDVGNIAKAHGEDGTPRALPRGYEQFAEAAASGLWTSANDLARFVQALIGSYRGESDFLPRATVAAMMTEVAPSGHGLGPRLNGAGATRHFHHGGANDSYLAWMEGHLETGDGLVVLTNGARGGALYDEIRNGVADSEGWAISRPLRTLAAPTNLADFAGVFAVDSSQPQAQRRMLDWFPPKVLVFASDGALSFGVEGDAQRARLESVGSDRFTPPDLGVAGEPITFDFQRDASGSVVGFSVIGADSRLDFRRMPADGGAGD